LQEQERFSGGRGGPFFVVFTDLDGTLLDSASYDWKEARAALDLCKRRHVPVVLASSKTRAEMEFFRGQLSLSAPLISENGGGIFFATDNTRPPPPGAALDKDLWRCSFGVPYPRLVCALQEIRDTLGWNIKGFSDMSVQEISRITGLGQEAARRAAMREYDEPFLVLDKQITDEKPLFEAAAKRGLSISTGGRFHHLHGENDKGRAMDKVISWYRESWGEVVSIALGDSPNDFPMLRRADYPVLVRSLRDFSALKREIPGLIMTREMGPKGWNLAVLDILGKRR
jgi:mannosyl-3-phosphoglycerate phosphatase